MKKPKYSESTMAVRLYAFKIDPKRVTPSTSLGPYNGNGSHQSFENT